MDLADRYGDVLWHSGGQALAKLPLGAPLVDISNEPNVKDFATRPAPGCGGQCYALRFASCIAVAALHSFEGVLFIKFV